MSSEGGKNEKFFQKSSETPLVGMGFDPRRILSNFDFEVRVRGGGGEFFGRDLFCGKFDETSFCPGPGLISFFV